MAKRKPVAPPKRRQAFSKADPFNWSGPSASDEKKIEAFLNKHFGRGKRKPGQRAPGPKKSTKNYVTPMKKKARKK